MYRGGCPAQRVCVHFVDAMGGPGAQSPPGSSTVTRSAVVVGVSRVRLRVALAHARGRGAPTDAQSGQAP